uniref:Uncharacterized protein n=1 Tax=Moniliophthora roreri TaxID=221103 RepID=A0A0W0FW60_MONRR
MNPSLILRISVPMNPPSSTNSNEPREDSEERLSSLAGNAFSRQDRDYVLHPLPVTPIPLTLQPSSPIHRTNSSTPLSQRIHEPLIAREESPTQLNEHDYSPPPPHVQHLPQCSNQELNDPLPPPLLNINNDSARITSSTLPMSRSTQDRRSVWDDEDIDEEPEELLPENRSRNPTPRIMERTEEVFKRLCALCAEWRNTAPLTAGSIVARSAPNVHLDIYLVTATTDEGLEELRSVTIPSVIRLLTTILQTTSPGMMRSTETENPEQPEPPAPRPAFVVDIGEEEGPRCFYRVNSPVFIGEWLHMGQPISNVDVRT